MRRRILLAVGLVLLLAIIGGGAFAILVMAPNGTGFAAKILCSAVFVSGREPETVIREDLQEFWYTSQEVNRENRSVSATILGMARARAVHREGLGCTLAVEIAPEELQKDNPGLPEPRVTRPLPWPTGEVLSDQPLPAGVDRDKLAAVLDDAFSEPDPENPRRTRAVVVVFDGRLVAERYASGIDRDTRLLGWSMTKSIIAALTGILVRQGKLSVQAQAKVPEWLNPGDPRGEITLEHLLRMSSGLAFEEKYTALTDVTRMLFAQKDGAGFAAGMPLEAKPGTRWSYSSGTSNIISRIHRRVFADDGAYLAFVRRALFDPIGMQTAVIEPDASGTLVGSSYGYATARDWARFGLLHLDDGVWEGERILPEGWVEFCARPTAHVPRREYGAHWWINAGDLDNPKKRRFPDLPPDTLQASGFEGQAVLVIPSRRTVIVRLGFTPGYSSDPARNRSTWDLNAFAARVLAALPE